MQTTETLVAEPVVEARHGNPRRQYLILKRGYDIFFAVVGLVLLAPFAIVVAVIIKLSDRGPVLYRQRRIGQHGRPFDILKLRTMVVGADKRGPKVTQQEDPRITRIGRILRRTKLDELPQLWNVLKGDMSFVGPRPEVSCYVDRYTPEQRQLLDFKPGITDLATLVFHDEEALLRTATDVEEFYVQHCIPRKFKLNVQYAKRANLVEDTLIILDTLFPYWLGIGCGYTLALAVALWVSYLLRFDFQVPEPESLVMHRFWYVIVPLQMLFLVWRKQVLGLLSYFGQREMKQLAYGLGLAAVVQLFVWFVTDGDLMPGRSIIVIDAGVAFVFLAGLRTFLRGLREGHNSRIKQMSGTTGVLRVGIVGAGELGGWLARQFNDRGKGRRRVDVFFDDDADKWNMQLGGIPVAGMPECLLDGSWSGKLDEVILAIPGAPPERVKQVLDILGSANIRVRTMPSLDELLTK